MITVNPSLTFNGHCESAFKYYEKCFNGKINVLMTWGDSPMADHVGPDMAKKVIHANLTIGTQNIIGGDAPPGHYQKPQGTAVCLNIPEVGEAERIFTDLSIKGTVQMPLAETFWAKRFGMCTDQFGTPWMINCGKEPQ